MNEHEFMLEDRLAVIRDTVKKYGEENFYVSFSGGKDSTVLHYLLDEAIPGNNIPRVFSNTGIEYLDIVRFVKELAKDDKRIIIVNNKQSIRKTLDAKGYPFKSKIHSHWLNAYQNNSQTCDEQIKELNDNPDLLFDIDHYDSITKNKGIIKYLFGIRERERDIYIYPLCCP